MKKKTVGRTILSHVGGILIFLVIYAVSLLISNYIKNENFQTIFSFIRDNLIILILIGLIFMIAEIFYIFDFPFNIPYPVFNAVGGLFTLEFIFGMLSVISKISNAGLGVIQKFEWEIKIIVVFLVILVGYVKVFFPSERKENEIEKKTVGWDKVGEEFKLLVYEIVSKARKSVGSKKKKSK